MDESYSTFSRDSSKARQCHKPTHVDLHIRNVQLRARTNQRTTHVATLDLLSDLMSDAASSKSAHNFDACNDFKPENVLIPASTTQEKQTTKEPKLRCGFIAPDLRFCLQGGGLARFGLAPRIVALFLLRLFLQPQYQFLDECSNFHKSSTIQRILLHLRKQSREILIVNLISCGTKKRHDHLMRGCICPHHVSQNTRAPAI